MAPGPLGVGWAAESDLAPHSGSLPRSLLWAFLRNLLCRMLCISWWREKLGRVPVPSLLGVLLFASLQPGLPFGFRPLAGRPPPPAAVCRPDSGWTPQLCLSRHPIDLPARRRSGRAPKVRVDRVPRSPGGRELPVRQPLPPGPCLGLSREVRDEVEGSLQCPDLEDSGGR